MGSEEASLEFRRAYWQVVRELDTERLREWERSRLTLPQLRVLFHIRKSPGITTAEMARLLGITVSTTSGLVIKLADRGLVQRTAVPDDRRQAALYLTDDASALVNEISDAWRPFLVNVAEALGDDLDSVTLALQRIAIAAGKIRASEQHSGEPEREADGVLTP
jgi:DNA-binding MarR family transcriptional regulator